MTALSNAVTVHGIGPDGSLEQLQSVSSDDADNGIVYASLAGGNFVYVNHNRFSNAVTRWPVQADGTLGSAVSIPTGGDGDPGFYASPRLLCFCGSRLYALNSGSRSIAVFSVAADGGLTPAPGSPFALPAAEAGSQSIAVDPSGRFLFAGTDGGRIVRFRVEPSGALSLAGTVETGAAGQVNGLEVDPSGCFLAAAIYDGSEGETNPIVVLRVDTLAPVPGSPFPSPGSAGIEFNGTGSLLFSGVARLSGTEVRVSRFQPAWEQGGAVTGRGRIPTVSGPGIFVVQAGVRPGGTPWGFLAYRNAGAGRTVVSRRITSVSVCGSVARLAGTASVNGRGTFDFTAIVSDLGRPGARADRFTLRVGDGHAAGPAALAQGDVGVRP